MNMLNKTYLLFFTILTISSVHAETMDDIFGGQNLELRKLVQKSEESNKLSGFFFLFMGEISGKSSNELRVYISWKTQKDQYVIAHCPVTKIRVKLDNSITTPTVSFSYSGHLMSDVNEELNSNYVKYLEIQCKESDWPVNISLPSFKEDITNVHRE